MGGGLGTYLDEVGEPVKFTWEVDFEAPAGADYQLTRVKVKPGTGWERP
jgi:hypothetical protein